MLLIEDNKADVFLIREALASVRQELELIVLSDGERAVYFFDNLDQDDTSPVPDLVLLDLNLPRRRGTEVLAHIRGSHRSSRTAVLVVTSSNAPCDRAATAELGVSGYFCKPSEYEGFILLGNIVDSLLASLRAI